MKKLVIGALLIGSFNIAFINSENTVSAAEISESRTFAAYAKPVIWAHPSKAKKIGNTFSTSATVSRNQLIKINKYFDEKETGSSAQAGIATTILTTPLNPYFAIATGTAVTMLTSYVNTQGGIVNDTLLKSTKNSFTVKITYSYRQTGSNDGYYSINKIRIY